MHNEDHKAENDSPKPNTKLRQERLKRQWTHVQLAERLDISDPRTISRWERGLTNPSPLSRQKLCEVFGKSEAELGLLMQYSEVSEQEISGEDLAQQPGDAGIEAQQLLPEVSASSGKETTRAKNRRRLIARVQAFWIQGLLEQSLHEEMLITLGLKTQTDALANPWRLVLELPDQLRRSLPSGTRITQVYDEAANELLILGEPGSGKTTLLLELARDMLARAALDENHPLPVIFNLSSWAVNQQPVERWIVDELNSKYRVPRKLGQTWVDTDHVLLLLDGLDEVNQSRREACIEALNLFHQQHTLIPMVVCSRSPEYFAQTARLAFNTAVTVQPLTPQQIDDYISNGSQRLAGLRALLRHDQTLQELATSPLMLSILALTYNGQSFEEIQSGDPTASRRQIFENYTQRMLQRSSMSAYYTPQQTTYWLAWLARRMKDHDQTVFYLERLQPSWFSEQRLQQHYQKLVKALLYALFGLFIGGIVGGLVSGLIIAPRIGQITTETSAILVVGLPLGMIAGLLVGLIAAIFSQREIRILPSESISWSWSSMGQDFLEALIIGTIGGALLWRIGQGLMSLFQPFSDLVVFWLTYQIGGILIGGIVGIVIASVKPGWFVAGQQGYTLSPQEKWRIIRKGLLLGLAVSLMEAVLDGRIGKAESSFFYPFVSQLFNEPVGRLASGLVGGLLGGLFVGIVSGFSNEQLDKQLLVKPNQGIWQSARHSVLICLLIWSLFWLIFVLLSVLAFKIVIGLVFGLFLGLIFGLLNGGIACLEHIILRLYLCRIGVAPWNYPRFLDYAATLIFLRKVGGGYLFTHRLLMDYFAELELKPAMVEPPLSPCSHSPWQLLSHKSHCRFCDCPFAGRQRLPGSD